MKFDLKGHNDGRNVTEDELVRVPSMTLKVIIIVIMTLKVIIIHDTQGHHHP